ncbi:MAG: uroporphyrinogen-III C-methyltransferase [Candidatus Sulfotelmatobacter sp.]
MNGKVYLVGAGPGDPELLTVKALRLLRAADVVLHDDLVAPEILQLISTAAEVRNVGKRAGCKVIRQEEINFMMVTLAAAGRDVVRLKSGDPLIFGRAGEEIDALRKAALQYEIVPGVTSALGAAAAAGIPLTHRAASSTLVLTVGHRASEESADLRLDDLHLANLHSTDPHSADHHSAGRYSADVYSADLSAASAADSTVAIYMPGSNYAGISRNLKSSGFADETPCAIISRATTSHQQVHLTTVSNLAAAPRLPSPALLIVGEVVRLANQNSLPRAMNVFDRKQEPAHIHAGELL